MAKLTKAKRDALPTSDFALPAKRALPIHDATHVEAAWREVDRTEGLSEDERAEARRHIIERAKKLGVDTSGWDKSLSASDAEEVEGEIDAGTDADATDEDSEVITGDLKAMSLAMPDIDGHPNAMPFEGVLFKIDQPSDSAPHGSGGRRIIIPKDVAEKATKTILAMGVDISPDLDDHSQQKIGVISEAFVDGEDFKVRGVIYASDFPKEAATIKALQKQLGFSLEACSFKGVKDGKFLKVTELTFSGAAILKAKDAAFRKTSLKASKQKDILAMDKDELKALIDEAIKNGVEAGTKPLQDEIATLKASNAELEKTLKANANICASVEPHAQALEAAAAEMEKAGVGIHPTRGHVAIARGLAKSLRASAVTGVFPSIHRDHDWPLYASEDKDTKNDKDVAFDETKVKELIASANKDLADKLTAAEDKLAAAEQKVSDLQQSRLAASVDPGRKTLEPALRVLLERAHVDTSDLSKIDINAILDAANVREPERRMAAKRALDRARA